MRYVFALLMMLLPLAAEAKVVTFRYPDIRQDFCGNGIDFRFCKCAFHGDYCKDVNMSKSAASRKVHGQFDAYVAERIEAFARDCMKTGIYGVIAKQCTYCEGDEVRNLGECVDPKDKRTVQERYRLPDIKSEAGQGNVGYVVSAEGEFFVYSPGRGKWIGPDLTGLQLYEGDVLYTTEKGRAQVRLGSTNYYVDERTQINLATPKRPRTLLERGAAFIWESVKRLATNAPLEIEGGAHSITAIKGTKFMMEVGEDGNATYALNEGVIEVRSKRNAQSKLELKAGEAAIATADGVKSAPYDWDALTRTYGLASVDMTEPTPPKPFEPIDPDFVDPPSAAFTGDLVGAYRTSAKGGAWPWVVALGLLGVIGYLAYAQLGTGTSKADLAKAKAWVARQAARLKKK